MLLHRIHIHKLIHWSILAFVQSWLWSSRRKTQPHADTFRSPLCGPPPPLAVTRNWASFSQSQHPLLKIYSAILRNLEFQAISQLIFSPPFPTSSSLETTVQLCIIFLPCISGSRGVLLEKRDYNKIAASILIDGATTLRTLIFPNKTYNRTLKEKWVRELSIFCGEHHLMKIHAKTTKRTTITWHRPTQAYRKQLG